MEPQQKLRIFTLVHHGVRKKAVVVFDNLESAVYHSFCKQMVGHRQVMGVTVQEEPRTIALSGSSTVRLKCGAMSGAQPWRTVRR